MDARRETAQLIVAGVAAFVAILAFIYIFSGVLGALIAGLAAGTIAGTATSSRRDAAVAAVVAALVAILLVVGASASFDLATVPAAAGAYLAWALTLAVASGGAAWATRLALEHFGRRWSVWLLLGCVSVAVVGGWFLALGAANAPDPLGSRPGMTQSEWLRTKADLTTHRDAELYLREYQMVAQGRSYYDAVVAARLEADPGKPVDMNGAVRFRLPTLFWLWAASPFSPLVTFTGGLLLLGSIGAFAAFSLGRTIGHPSLAAAAAASVAAYFASDASRTIVTFSEPWAAALVLVSAAAWALHITRKGDRAWLIVSVVSALFAALFRELAVFALVAGLVASFSVERSGRRTAVLLWGSALVIFIAAYVAHLARLGGTFFGGGAELAQWTILSAQRFLIVASQGDRFLLGLTWLSVVFVLLGLAGSMVAPVSGWRAYAITVAVLPLAAFSIVGPTGTLAPGMPIVPVGYWGILVKPLLWAMLPAAAYLLRRPSSSGSGTGGSRSPVRAGRRSVGARSRS